jgi:hypothetical protein
LVENREALRILQRVPALADPLPVSIVELLLAIGVYCDREAFASSLAFPWSA